MPNKKTEKSKITKSARKEEKVGKGKPPEHTRFGKGKSGNPRGRPKGSKNLATIISDAANAQVTATVDGQPRRISKVTATAMQMATKAAGGDHRSMAELLDWIDEIEAREAAAKPLQFPFSALDLEVLRETYERMKQCTSVQKTE